MTKTKYIEITDRDFNFYLKSRNLIINRQFSAENDKINNLDHYIWWFSKKNRSSYFVQKADKNLMILTEEVYFKDGKKIIISGLISCINKIDLKDLLNAIKWQNENVLKHKNAINLIFVSKKNIFGNLQNKYFKFSKLIKNTNLYKKINKEIKIDLNVNVYFKEIK